MLPTEFNLNKHTPGTDNHALAADVDVIMIASGIFLPRSHTGVYVSKPKVITINHPNEHPSGIHLSTENNGLVFSLW